jgi:hypothetical protein
VYVAGFDQASILLHAALAAKWHEPPRDALDTLVLGQVDLAKCDEYTQTDFMPFDPTIKRTEGTLRGPDGKARVSPPAACLAALRRRRSPSLRAPHRTGRWQRGSATDDAGPLNCHRASPSPPFGARRRCSRPPKARRTCC